MDPVLAEAQRLIRDELEVVRDFDAEHEANRRIAFLADYLEQTKMRGYVLGISGGIDSTLAGRLAQLACAEVRRRGGDARFIAVRLPYQVQQDEADAQAALAFICADEVASVNVGPATDALWDQVVDTAVADHAQLTHFVKGNVKARMRMVAQYTIAGARGMLVIGTDQAAEAVTGFYTKFGDGACDLTPLTGLTKRMVREVARHLGCPDELVDKVPTADLESDKPLLADEVALGVTYRDIDTFLEGGEVSDAAARTILGHHRRSAHKRAMPVTPARFEARQK